MMSWHEHTFHITGPWWGKSTKHQWIPVTNSHPDSKVHRANMGPIWGRQDPGGLHVGPMNLAIWAVLWSVDVFTPQPQWPGADPGFAVRGGANGLENLKSRGGGMGWGYCVNIFKIYISITTYSKWEFLLQYHILKAPLYNNIVLKIVFIKFLGRARARCTPL